jgi:hypothetical protein
VRQSNVVSNKLFPKIRRLCGQLLEIRENENLVRKIPTPLSQICYNSFRDNAANIFLQQASSQGEGYPSMNTTYTVKHIQKGSTLFIAM